jgi:hypothetical protein
MADQTTVLYTLAVADVLLYALMTYQLVRGRRGSRIGASDATEAFTILGSELRAAIPTIQRGFTWREGIQEARGLHLDIDWERLGREVEGYEAFRYGGEARPGQDYGEVLALARELRKAR